ncbi:unnamed protein product [Rotaria socialis]|uniref:Uncharacterized protein n=1 Tax=Rotaria socialis TaxID=392032 RepID=A0A821DKP1_9BILA|nr:unnamed protein product [Rotaria socialis]
MNNVDTSILRHKLNRNVKTNEYAHYNNLQDQEINISKQAFNYAVEQHFPPFDIKRTPKLSDHEKGKEIINAIFIHIEKDFKKLNKHYAMQLGFEYWYIDKNGDLSYYPTSLAQTNILPSRPKHLPSQHSLILKYVPNYITLEEIQMKLAYIEILYLAQKK